MHNQLRLDEYPLWEISTGLDACTLIHHSPQHNRAPIEAALTTTSSDEEYVLSEPEFFNLHELEALFEREASLPYSAPFSHPCVVPEADDAPGQQYPLYAECPDLPFFEVPKGIDRGEKEDRYCLVASQGDAPIGFVTFTLGLEYCLDVDTDQAIADRDTEALTEIALVVTVQHFYVRKQFRRQGVAAAMAQAIGYAYSAELGHLCSSVERIADRAGQLITVTPIFRMELECQSAAVVAAMVESTVEAAVEDACVSTESENVMLDELQNNSGYW